jgi:hypothetical protein
MDKYNYIMEHDHFELFNDFLKDNEINIKDTLIAVVSKIEYVDDDTIRINIDEAPNFEELHFFDGTYDGFYERVFSNQCYVYYCDNAVLNK